MPIDEFSLEEYKLVKARAETHENRYYQMLVISITGFATILGVSEKIPEELIPYMISPFLLITTGIAISSRRHQYFEGAYILEAFENRIPYLSVERVYYEIFSTNISRLKVWKAIKVFFGFLREPFTVLNMLGIISSIYFGNGFVLEKWAKNEHWISILYIGVLILIYSIIVKAAIDIKKRNLTYYRKRCKDFIAKLDAIQQIPQTEVSSAN